MANKVVGFIVVYVIISVMAAFQLGVSVAMDFSTLYKEVASQELDAVAKARVINISFVHLCVMSAINLAVALAFVGLVMRRPATENRTSP